MAYYFVASIRIHDPEEYQKYLESVDQVFSRYNGEYVAVDESPIVVEGKWDYSKSVIIRFPSKKDFKDWYYSSDYQKILRHRLRASQCDTILMKGMK